jgi:hypothetical protein
MSLLRYTKADDVKIKEYNLAIDKLIKEGIKKKADLDSEITETRAAQIQLDKVLLSPFPLSPLSYALLISISQTGEAFRKLHQERQELIRYGLQYFFTCTYNTSFSPVFLCGNF